jgi:hypothetical protein
MFFEPPGVPGTLTEQLPPFTPSLTGAHVNMRTQTRQHGFDLCAAAAIQGQLLATTNTSANE